MTDRAICAGLQPAPSPHLGIASVARDDAMALRCSPMLAALGMAGACACALAVMLVLAPRIGFIAAAAVALAVALGLVVCSQWQERMRPIAIKVEPDGVLTWHRQGAPVRYHRIVGHARPAAGLLVLRLAPDEERATRRRARPGSVLIAADAIEPAHFRELAIALARQRRRPG
ncbi:protein YgfX [Mycetohabitans sp. B46]|uniref:protein YgfX n=1 Tax=Mycetohabitans sp. B46 TaxID=2772536 RepID=UPI00307E437E